MITVPAGGDVIMELPGGGGMGNPRLRPSELVLADVESGLVTIDSARHDYAVVVHQLGAHWSIDGAATTRLRHDLQPR
jgi:N-methylhydantoinase B